jgi:hypothetical protein
VYLVLRVISACFLINSLSAASIMFLVLPLFCLINKYDRCGSEVGVSHLISLFPNLFGSTYIFLLYFTTVHYLQGSCFNVNSTDCNSSKFLIILLHTDISLWVVSSYEFG